MKYRLILRKDGMSRLGREAYYQPDRFEILYGTSFISYPCEKCKKIKCKGEKKCKGFGGWSYGVSV